MTEYEEEHLDIPDSAKVLAGQALQDAFKIILTELIAASSVPPEDRTYQFYADMMGHAMETSIDGADVVRQVLLQRAEDLGRLQRAPVLHTFSQD